MEEQTNIFAVSLYTVPEIGYTRQAFNRTVANAIAQNSANASVQAIPWISLGSGYRREFDTYEAYDLHWNYDYIYRYTVGPSQLAISTAAAVVSLILAWCSLTGKCNEALNCENVAHLLHSAGSLARSSMAGRPRRWGQRVS